MAKDVSNAEQVDPETGEVMTVLTDTLPLAVQLAQAELNQAVTTARAFPRSITRAVSAINTLATLDERTSKACTYALPRGGKPIVGPSVRFAEIVASQWGNCQAGSRVVDIDRFNKVIIAEGVFHDLETGYRRVIQITRRAVDRQGRLFNDDMLMVTSNAAGSIAYREAVLKSVPQGIWIAAYERCLAVMAGDVKTLAERRAKMIAAFATWGVTPEQIFASLDIGGIDDVGLDEITTLTAIVQSIKDKANTVEDYFPPKANAADAAAAAKGTAGKLADIAAGKDKTAETAADTGKPAGDGDGKPVEEKPKTAAKAKPAATEPKPETTTPPPKEKAKPAPAEAKAEDKTDTATEVEAGGDGAEDLLGDKRPQFTDDDVEAAFKRGVAARAKGMARKATPPEWRDEANAGLLEAYLRGFDGD